MTDMERARRAPMTEVAALQLMADTIGDLLAEVVPELDRIAVVILYCCEDDLSSVSRDVRAVADKLRAVVA